jgi:acetyl esterase/lipase
MCTHPKIVALLVIALLMPLHLRAGEILSGPPNEADPDTHYVFYLHGQIVQDVGPRPTHPRYGLYDYPLILDTLAQGDVTVISERREPGTNREKYALQVAEQVRELLSAGASPANITVVGFSAGGVIAIHASSRLSEVAINFVFLAACSGWMTGESELRLNGNVLSVFEQSDQTTSCKELADRSPRPASFDEFSINTGKEHGAFYLPNEEWVQPVLKWILR